MMMPLLLLLQVAGGPTASGVQRQLRVTVPRLDSAVAIDGRFDEGVWRQAALLTGFTQYDPADNLPATDSTQVMVWYSATAIHFGIRAYEAHGAPHATRADRDGIFADDNIQILLGTFPGGQQAMMFAVNPFGLQGDGVMTETGSKGSNVREEADRNIDYVYESVGRLTDWGYQIEVRIPFRNLRYPSGSIQQWQLNVVRETKHSGTSDSWAPVSRASASFLGQSGTLEGLYDLHQGLVIDATPELSSRVVGEPGNGAFDYRRENPKIGGNVRWSISSNMTLNGTVKPDFSQVESDAGQLGFDPRQSLFFAEKRPFFLDGIEQFQTPYSLVYTRRVVQPVAALKLTGNVAGNSFGILSAVDSRFASDDGKTNPVFNILRVQHNFAGQSRLGVTYTDRIEGSHGNRVGSIDGRMLFGGVYSAQFQVAQSWTRDHDGTAGGPLWHGQLVASGRRYGLIASMTGISEHFNPEAGFLPRTGIVQATIDPSIVFYGKPGATIESVGGDISASGTWRYRDFVRGNRIQDQKLHFTSYATLRGGWQVIGGYFVESFGYDPSLYASYALEAPRSGGGLDTIPFTGQPTIPNSEVFFQVSAPQWKRFNANMYTVLGYDENFPEWASGRFTLIHGDIAWRPTDRVRISATYNWQQVNRPTDNSIVLVGKIPRLKMEYQLTRSIFVRLVGQYSMERTDALRDASRTEAPILIRGDDGEYHRTAVESTNLLQGSGLFSYQPTPGTVVFVGYNGLREEERPFKFSRFSRLGESFFVKLSYAFRL